MKVIGLHQDGAPAPEDQSVSVRFLMFEAR